MPRSPHTHLASLVAVLLLLAGVADGAAAGSYKVARRFDGTDFSFGNALALTPARLAIGAYFELGSSGRPTGAVYLYDRASGAPIAHLTSPSPGYFFGSDVALAGDLLAVGEQFRGVPPPDDGGGAVHVFEATTGAYLRTLANPSPTEFFNLGTAVAAADGVVAASAPLGAWPYSERGAVFVYDAATGAVLRTIVDPTGGTNGYFGRDLAIAGGELFVGQANYDAPGAVWRFDLATGALLGTITHPDPNARGFGAPLAVFDSRLAVAGADAVLLFDRTSGALLRTITTPFPDGKGFGATLDLDAAGLLVLQPPLPRPPVLGEIGAVLLFDPDSGAVRTVIPEAPDGILSPPRFFGGPVRLDGDDLFMVAGRTGGLSEVVHYVPACGDGVLDACERCDDGNRVSGDGCDADCRLESCGNGSVEAGEECDDGNAVDGDGCDSNCTLSGCGNCVVAGGETCDDGNTHGFDGCDANCTYPSCGNGEVGFFESCDDANDVAGDGCSPICKAEVCGDGTVDAGESCDDGNHDDGDGCDGACRLETAKLDWWRDIYAPYGVFAGDDTSPSGQLFVTHDKLFVLARGGDTTFATVSDRETGAHLHTFPDDEPSMVVDGNDVLITDYTTGLPVVHLYDADTFVLRQTFTDPTPNPLFAFGRFMRSLGDVVLIHDEGDQGVHVFDVATGAFERTLVPPTPPGAPAPSYTPAFGAVMTPFRAGVLLSDAAAAYLYEPATGTVLQTYVGPGGTPIAGVRAQPVGDDVLLPTTTGEAHLADGATGAIKHTFTPPGLAPANAASWIFTVAGDAVVVASPALGVVHVFDATTYALRFTLHDPTPGNGSCFGAPIARLDVGLAVSDPCEGADETGEVYLFDHVRGQHIATIVDPNRGYLDHFGTRNAFGNTLLTKYEADDDGVIDAWRPTIDGRLDPGEECDDANLVNGDGCDMNGTVTRCGNGFRTAGERCDDGNRRGGDGCEPDCTPTFACAGPVGLDQAALTLRNLGGKPDDDVLVLTGRLTGVDPSVSALANGAQLLVEDATGAPVLDLTARTTPVPAGARGTGCGANDGWRADPSREIYVNASGALGPACTPGSAHGLTRIVLRRGTDGLVVEARVRRATLPVFTGPLRVVMALGADATDGLNARCGAHAFGSLGCRANRRGTAIVCR